MNWLKNKTLSLGTASEEKIIHDSVSISICISEKNLKNLSLDCKIFFCQQYIQGWKKTKISKK